jgi:hypothetical protein
MNSMQVKVTSGNNFAGKYWEGMVTLNGLRPTKLQKINGCTRFNARSAATQAANALARRLGCSVEYTGNQKAAKRSVNSR